MYKNILKTLRLRNNLRQKDIARILDIAEISYTHYENEYYIMPTKYLNIIVNYFQITFDYLFTFTSNYESNAMKTEIDKKLSGERLKAWRKTNKITQLKLA